MISSTFIPGALTALVGSTELVGPVVLTRPTGWPVCLAKPVSPTGQAGPRQVGPAARGMVPAGDHSTVVDLSGSVEQGKQTKLFYTISDCYWTFLDYWITKITIDSNKLTIVKL